MPRKKPLVPPRTRKKQLGSTENNEAPEHSTNADNLPDLGVDVRSAILSGVDDSIVYDIITEITRRCRKSLLAACLICFTVTWADLFPREINALGAGFEVTELQRTNLLYLLALVTAYYSLAFISYCFSDSRLRKLRIRQSQLAVGGAAEVLREELEAVAGLENQQFTRLR